MTGERESKPKKILLVGAGSYIGRNLKEYLESGQFREAYWVDSVSASDGGWERISFQGYDCLVLLAALVHKKETPESRELYYRVNRDMAMDIARKAKKEKVGQLVFMSTMAVYGHQATVITKETKPAPNTYYGSAKLEAEQGIWKLADKDFMVAVVRPPMVYGKDCPGNYGRLQKAAKFFWLFPAVDNKRSMVEIGELVDQLEKIIREKRTGYFFPQDQEYGNTTKMVVEMRRQMGKKTWVVKGLEPLIRMVGKRVRGVGKVFGDCWYDGKV